LNEEKVFVAKALGSNSVGAFARVCLLYAQLGAEGKEIVGPLPRIALQYFIVRLRSRFFGFRSGSREM